MIVENLFLLAGAPQGERPATTPEDEGGGESFNSLFEDSLITEQTPPPAPEGGALPAAEAERATADDDFSLQSGMVSMEEITNNLELTEKQISRLATLLGISADEMVRMEITAKNPGRDFLALMPDGTSKNLAALLNLVENGQLLDRQEAVARIADMLGLSKTGAAALLKELGIFSFEIFGETAPPKAATAQTAQQGETTASAQGKMENNIQPSGHNNGQNANNNNNASGETAAASVNETDGDFTKAERNQAAQTTAPIATIAEGEGLKTPVAPGIRVFQPFTLPGGTEETNAGKHAKAVMNRIVEKASIISFPNRTQARISLSPPSLGFVNIEISTRNEGASALIVVESHAVKQIIEQNIHQLKTAFEQQGIKVEAINVSVAEQGGNSFENDARFKETQSAFSDYAAGGEVTEENPEDDALQNERMRKKAGSYYILDIKV